MCVHAYTPKNIPSVIFIVSPVNPLKALYQGVIMKSI